MKTFRTALLIIIPLLLVIIIIKFQNCDRKSNKESEEQSENTFINEFTPEKKKKCKELTDKAYRKEIIIKFNQCKIDENPNDFDNTLKALDKYIDPIDTCSCDSTLIRYNIKQGIDPEDAVAETNKKIQPRGIGDAYFNFNIAFHEEKDNIIGALKSYEFKENITIALIDGGIDTNIIPGLEDFLWINTNTSDPNATTHGYNFADDSPSSMISHGALISKILTHNLDSKKLKLMDLRVFDKNGNGILSDALCAMQFAINNNADLMNLSWGYYNQRVDPNLQKYIQRAKNEGIIIVASAGNDSINTDHCHHYPSGFDANNFQIYSDNVVSVAYLDDSNTNLAPLSNYGFRTVSLAAPGTFGDIEGSSYSAPHITRLAAILKSNNPDKNYRDIINCLLWQADTIPTLPLITFGKLTYTIDQFCDPDIMRFDDEFNYNLTVAAFKNK